MVDSPALTEIEIAPEMIEAGVLCLFDYDPKYGNEEDTVSLIFLAMLDQTKTVVL
jgi:hypothetical protein